jgi:FkbM family methyltransferase
VNDIAERVKNVVTDMEARAHGAVRAAFRGYVRRERHGWFAGAKVRGRVPKPQRPPTSPATLREIAHFRGLALPGKVAYDIGANTGSHVWRLAHAVGPTGRVFAFEPVPGPFGALDDLVRLNDLHQVTLFAVAIGDRAGLAELVLPDDASDQAGSIDPRLTGRGDGRRLSVPVFPLDEWVQRLDLPDPDFVKVDVEGFEAAVLRGARGVLKRARPRLFIEIHGGDASGKSRNARDVLHFLHELDYTARHFESGRTLTPADAGHAREGHIIGDP